MTCPNLTNVKTPYDLAMPLTTQQFNSQISISSEEDKAEQKQYDQSDVPFRHVFKITNDGPSPQNKPVKLTAFVTDSELVTLTCKFLSLIIPHTSALVSYLEQKVLTHTVRDQGRSTV